MREEAGVEVDGEDEHDVGEVLGDVCG